MSAHVNDAKQRFKASLYERETLSYEMVSEAAYAYDTATGHATGVAQFEAMLEFLAEGRALQLEGFPARESRTKVRSARELAEVVEAHFSFVSLREDLGRYFGGS